MKELRLLITKELKDFRKESRQVFMSWRNGRVSKTASAVPVSSS